MSSVWVIVGCYDYEPSTVLAVFTDEGQANAIVDEWMKTRAMDRCFSDLEIARVPLDTINKSEIYI